MIELVEATDSRAVRNKNNVLALYDLMINQKRSEEATAKFVSPSYIQHNPLIPDGSGALGRFFAKVTRERARARVVVNHCGRRLRVGTLELSQPVQRRSQRHRHCWGRYLSHGR